MGSVRILCKPYDLDDMTLENCCLLLTLSLVSLAVEPVVAVVAVVSVVVLEHSTGKLTDAACTATTSFKQGIGRIGRIGV